MIATYLNGAVTVERRSDDYKAFLTDQPAAWDCGRTPSEAIGALVRTHPERFAVLPAGTVLVNFLPGASEVQR